MSRVLLADDSSHAQRMGERILSDEGFEVVTVTDGESALIRLEDVDPDVVIADAVMPGRTGYDICGYIRMSPRHGHVRVILTAGALETLDENEVRRVEAHGTLRKPFEATALIETVRQLAVEAAEARKAPREAAKGAAPAPRAPAEPVVAVLDAEKVRAAVTVALDASMAAMVEEITARVLAALTAPMEAGQAEEQAEACAPPTGPLRARAASRFSILGLNGEDA